MNLRWFATPSVSFNSLYSILYLEVYNVILLLIGTDNIVAYTNNLLLLFI